jgi:uncharacterized protein (TIRG00374 family)
MSTQTAVRPAHRMPVHQEAVTGPPPPAPARPPRRGRRILLRALRVLLAAAAVGLLVRFLSTGWPEVRASLSLLTARHAPLVGLAIAVEALWVLAMSQVYRSALRAFGGAVSRRTVLRISMAAFTLSRILPGGGAAGGAVAARELIALGNPALHTIVSMLVSWWISMTALSSLVTIGIAVSVAIGTLPAGHLIAPAVALVAFLVIGAAIAVAARNARLRERLSSAIIRGVRRTTAADIQVHRDPISTLGRALRVRGLVAVLAWSGAVWLLDGAALWLSLAAFGWYADIGVLLVGYGVANLIGALPELTPGWLGVLEASVAVALSALGVPEGIAVVAVLVYRLVSYWLPTIAGIPAAVGVLGRGIRTARTKVAQS